VVGFAIDPDGYAGDDEAAEFTVAGAPEGAEGADAGDTGVAAEVGGCVGGVAGEFFGEGAGGTVGDAIPVGPGEGVHAVKRET